MIRYFVGAAAVAALLATPAYAQQTPVAILKICKIGNGITPGTPFHFNVFTWQVVVPSGSPPGGSCWIGGGIPVNSTVTVTETDPGYTVTNITLTGGGVLSAAPPNPAATISHLPAGMSVLTYTNEPKKMGYMEICKRVEPEQPGPASFNFNVAGFGSVTVPNLGCTPPLQVPAGSVTVTENAPGYEWFVCARYQGGVYISTPPCVITGGNTATIQVVAGGVQDETLLFVYNRPQRGGAAAPPERLDDAAIQAKVNKILQPASAR